MQLRKTEIYSHKQGRIDVNLCDYVINLRVITVINAFQDCGIFTLFVFIKPVALIFKSNRNGRIYSGTIWPKMDGAKKVAKRYIVFRGKSWKYHGNIIKPVRDVGSGSMKIARNLTFGFDLILPAQGLRKWLFWIPHTRPPIIQTKSRLQ